MPSKDVFSFKVGRLQCTVISDGIRYPEISHIPDRFPGVNEEKLIQVLQDRNPESDTVEWSMNCLLIQSDDHNLLVDTGTGMENGKLIPHLQDILPLQNIDTVLLTHGHPDHIGGLVDEEGQLTFPRAAYFMRDLEWEYWMGPQGVIHGENEDYAALLRATLRPIEDQITLLGEERDILPGIHTLDIFGHTPGHTGLRIESEGEALLHLVDALHVNAQLAHPDWSPRFDIDPDLAARSRKRVLSHAAGKGTPTLLFHVGFPGLARIRKQDGEYFLETWSGR